MSFNSLRRKKAHEEVADQIRACIFAQQLHVGDLLPAERQLAEQFGVSRVVVREAIRTLELTGFVRVKKGPRGGSFITGDFDRPISESILNLLNVGEVSLDNLFEIRQLIEPYAAARAVGLASEKEVRVLEAIIKEAEISGEAGHSSRSHNLDFHRHILHLGRNPILTAIGETVLLILSEQIKHIYSPESSRAILKTHRDIFAAIRERDAAKAHESMARDIYNVGELFTRIQAQGNVKKRKPSGLALAVHARSPVLPRYKEGPQDKTNGHSARECREEEWR